MHWQYWTLYPVVPEPIVRVSDLFEDINTDLEYHVEAFFAEYENPAFNSFSVLTRYLAFKLTDDPTRDRDELVKEFMNGYYGPAASKMTELLNFMDERQRAFESAIGNVEMGFRPYLDDEYFARTLGLLSEAENAAAGQSEILARIRREKPCLLAGLLSRWPALKDHSPYDAPALIEEFRASSYASMEHFFKEDNINFRKSEHFDETVERFFANFQATTSKTAGGLPPPEGVNMNDQETISLNASQFLYEAKAKFADDPKAFGGKNCVYNYENDNLNLVVNNWMDGIMMAKSDLNDDILPRDGQYHWIEVADCRFTNNGRAHLLIPDHCQGIRCEFYRRVLPGSSYRIYASLKCDDNDKTIAMDRVLMVRIGETASVE